MSWRRSIALLAALLVPAGLPRPAAADEVPATATEAEATTTPEAPPTSPKRASVSDEVGLSNGSSTQDNPRAGSTSNNLNGSINLTDSFAFDLGFSVSSNQGTPAPPGSNFDSPGGVSSVISLGFDWEASDHWNTSALFDFSPQSTTKSGTQLTYQEKVGTQTVDVPVNAQVTAKGTDKQLGFTVGYDSAGESDVEWIFTLGITGEHLNTNQVVSALERADGKTITKPQVIAFCNAQPTTSKAALCTPAFKAALKEQDYSLDSLKLSAGVVSTLFNDTDLGLTFDGYGYNQDPTQVGYFSIVRRVHISGGAGVPISPLRAAARLDVTQRFGGFSVKAWSSAGQYYDQDWGSTYSAGLKLQYKFNRSFRLWATYTWQHDTDPSGNDSVTNSGTLGAGYRF